LKDGFRLAAVQIFRANVGGCRYLPVSGRRSSRQLVQEPVLLRISAIADGHFSLIVDDATVSRRMRGEKLTFGVTFV
jgi:hypothetical protein